MGRIGSTSLLDAKKMDTLLINQLELQVTIGVHPHERRATQPVYITLELGIDLCVAKQSDQLSDTLDYDDLIEKISSLTSSTHFNLIEHLADKISRLILDKYPMVQTCTVLLEKPHAIPTAKSSGIRLTTARCRSDTLSRDLQKN